MLPHRIVICATLLLVLSIQTDFAHARKRKHQCPIGFNIAYTKTKGDPICYRRKGPEYFNQKYEDCTGNLYTSRLYYNLNLTQSNITLWAEYESIYPGGPFTDWSEIDSKKKILEQTGEIYYDPTLGLDEPFCVVIDPVLNLIATRCSGKHYRYCFVKPYPRDKDDIDTDGCGVPDYWRFWSPKSTCLSSVPGAGGGAVRATWKEAQRLCGKRQGSLLSIGWRYANNPFLISNPDTVIPLGLVLSPDKKALRYDTASENETIPSPDWNFEAGMHVSNETSLGALQGDYWYLVNSSYRFFDVICERPIQLETVELQITTSADTDNKIILTTSKKIDKDHITCFTDSLDFSPESDSINIIREDDHTLIVQPLLDGYYWCRYSEYKKYHTAESNKALFIRAKESLINYYAVKIRTKEAYPYPMDSEYAKSLLRDSENTLKEYIYYRTLYVKAYEEFNTSDPGEIENILKEFRDGSPGLKWKKKHVLSHGVIKRIYLDGRTLLLHVRLSSEMLPLPPGVWDDVEVLFMKPVYYCPEYDTVKMLALGQSNTSIACRNYTCVGDFNEGVQMVTSAADGCTTEASSTVVQSEYRFTDTLFMPTATVVNKDLPLPELNARDSSEEDEKTRPSTTSTTTVTPEIVSTVDTPTFPETTSTEPPTTTTLPPQQQLQHVMDNLEALMSNESAVIQVHDVEDTFDQVDNILENEEILEIPGEFLHLLDQLGSRIQLGISTQGAAVRNNIAMLLADASPTAPVRGLKIAARQVDEFTADAFEIISDEVNSTHLVANENEAVVQLPASIAISTRRISFVVFRNDRAFQSDVHDVNSRILSINVENLTKFEDGEVIDIHLSPLNNMPERNQSRTCAYWHFVNDTGFWSEDGCTLIRATGEGMLDTCRCNHLTHFAEILVPRTVFSERNENALEIISIIGCCVSILGLFLIALTAILFRSWRRDFSNKVWLQLCLAILLLVICFLITAFVKFETYDIPCMLLGVALHYSTLASFCWMLVAAILSYRRLVIVFTRDASHKLLKAAAFSWGVPCAIVGILLSVAPHSYGGQFVDKIPSAAFCYPSGLALYLTVYGPIALMLIANWTLFGLIVRSVFASRRIQRHGDTNEALRCASVSCLLVFLFGLPWIFGLFSYNIVAAYLFTLLATFQGFVLFLFFVVGNKKTRDLWLNKLKIKQTRKIPVTSSTYTNRSTGGPGYRGGSNPSSIEANSSKPRSLSSPDNSRFS